MKKEKPNNDVPQLYAFRNKRFNYTRLRIIYPNGDCFFLDIDDIPLYNKMERRWRRSCFVSNKSDRLNIKRTLQLAKEFSKYQGFTRNLIFLANLG